MKLLRRKKVKLNFVLAAMASCFCMLLVTPIIGEQFGFANSFSESVVSDYEVSVEGQKKYILDIVESRLGILGKTQNLYLR